MKIEGIPDSFYEKEIGEHKIIAILNSGAKLHGTERESSDKDYMGLYIPSVRSLYLENDKGVITFNSNKENKNLSSDIDLKLLSVFEFFKKLEAADNNSVDMLFALKDKSNYLFGYENKIVKYLRENIEHLFIPNYYGMKGFAISQVERYEIKFERYNSLKKIIPILKKLPPENELLMYIETITKIIKENNLRKIFFKEKNSRHYLSIVDKLFDITFKVGYILNECEKALSKYGDRVVNNKEGSDFKAYSHALRSLLESKELIETNDLKFPLKDRSYLKDIKEGKIDKEEVSDKIKSLNLFIENYMKSNKSNILNANKKIQYFVKEDIVNLILEDK